MYILRPEMRPMGMVEWFDLRSAREMIPARGIRGKIRGTLKLCRDPNDDMFLECAAPAGRICWLQGDKDLLILGAYKGTRMITPSEYLGSG
jgi:predicted nucleic acid-binding protein